MDHTSVSTAAGLSFTNMCDVPPQPNSMLLTDSLLQAAENDSFYRSAVTNGITGILSGTISTESTSSCTTARLPTTTAAGISSSTPTATSSFILKIHSSVRGIIQGMYVLYIVILNRIRLTSSRNRPDSGLIALYIQKMMITFASGQSMELYVCPLDIDLTNYYNV